MYKCIIIGLFLLPFFGRAQENLIQNGGFEEIDTGPPTSNFNFDRVYHWDRILSPDVFSGFQACPTTYPLGVPCNATGYAMPFQDSSYAGVATERTDTSITDFFYHGEYITQKLKKKLRRGAEYRFSFQTIQSDTSEGYFENAFVLFSKEDLSTMLQWQFNILIRKQSQYFPFTTDTLNWQKAEYTFTAGGGEQYILFGILDSAKYFIPYRLPLPPFLGPVLQVTTYYYIDDVRLVELPDTLSSELTLPNTFTPNGDLQNDVWRPIANNIASYALQVFNRYGALVYEQSGPEVEWNGEAPNGPASEGVYFMVLQAKGNEGKEYTERQTVHLFR
jgi:gliding motility-associated-like protein